MRPRFDRIGPRGLPGRADRGLRGRERALLRRVAV